MKTRQIHKLAPALLPAVLTATIAALVAWALSSGASLAASSPVIPAPVFNQSLPYSSAVKQLGQQRLRELNPKLSVHRSKAMQSDPTAWVDKTGKAFFVEPAMDTRSSPPSSTQNGQSPAAGAASAGVSSIATADAFNLESRAGSNRTIYLDFDGVTGIVNTGWNGAYGAPTGSFDAVPFDLDGNSANFNTAERQAIISVWQRVSEDYAPFEVNVTTKDPGYSAINRSGSNDQIYGTTAVITSMSNMIAGNCNCGGIAYVDVFSDAYSHDYYQPAWVFAENLSGADTKSIAEAATHEVGHNLGLSHDGTSSVGYYGGAGVWSPIMGVGYYRPLVQWSKGEYPNANNNEDDLSVIAASGVNAVSDDFANTAAAASPLSAGALSKTGLISDRNDVDVFKFSTDGGALDLAATVAGVSPNLDVKLQLKDAAGNVVLSNDPASAAVGYDPDTGISGLSASLSTTVAAGSYSIWVEGVGSGNLSTGYSDYASLGAYTLSGSIPAASTLTPPTITGFSVSSALVGSHVVITGTHLTGATAVRVNEVSASFSPISDTQLDFTVPEGASTGRVSVTTADGTGASSVDFVVYLAQTTGPNPSIVASNGSVRVGETLSVNLGTWIPQSTTFSYIWYLDGSPISGAVAPTLVLDNSTAGHRVSVQVTGSASQYISSNRLSAETEIVTGGSIQTDYVAQVSGNFHVGSTLTAAPFYGSPTADSVIYNWFSSIAGQETLLQSSASPTLTLTNQSAGGRIRLQVLANRVAYNQLEKGSGLSSEIVVGGTLTKATPTISGTWATGGMLTAAANGWLPSATTFGFEWLRNSQPIAGATAATYTLTPADFGSAISVRVTGSAAGFDSVSATSSATTLLVKGTITANQATWDGTFAVGNVLSFTFNPTPACDNLSVKWRADGDTVQSGGSVAYWLGNSVAGKKIDAVLVCSSDGYDDLQQTLSPTATIIGGSFSKVNPVLSGVPLLGKTLTATTGSWNPAAESLVFTWYRDGLLQSGHSSSTYLIGASDVGHRMQVSVTAGRKGFDSAIGTSQQIGPIRGGQLAMAGTVLSGTAAVGKTLVVSAHSATASVSFGFQWKRNGVSIRSATGSKYKLVKADRGARISVQVTASKASYDSVKKLFSLKSRVR